MVRNPVKRTRDESAITEVNGYFILIITIIQIIALYFFDDSNYVLD